MQISNAYSYFAKGEELFPVNIISMHLHEILSNVLLEDTMSDTCENDAIVLGKRRPLEERSEEDDESFQPEIETVETAINRVATSNSIYDTLAVPSISPSKKMVRQNFLKTARLIHPDRCDHELASVCFLKLKGAYEKLINDFDNPNPIPYSNDSQKHDSYNFNSGSYAVFTGGVDMSAKAFAPDAIARRRRLCTKTSRLLRESFRKNVTSLNTSNSLQEVPCSTV